MNGKSGIYEKAMDLAQRIGPVFGALGGLFYAAAYGYPWLLDVLDPAKPGDRGDFAQMCFGLTFGVVAAGLGRGQKKQTDIIVASEAEKRLDPNTAFAAKSSVPQIQKEIESQRADATVTNRETK